MPNLAVRAQMTVSGTPGTGTITLAAATSGYRSFAAAGVPNGALVSYVIVDGANWEAGTGTYTSSGTTLARTTIIASSNGGAAITASSGAVVSIDALVGDFKLVSRAYAELTTVSGTTSIIDPTQTPTSSSGLQILSATLTPASTANRIRIQFNGSFSTSQVYSAGASPHDALVILASVGTTVVDIVRAPFGVLDDNYFGATTTLNVETTAPATSATTVSIRIGTVAGSQLYTNGNGTPSPIFGGLPRCTLIVEEIAP